MCTSLLPYGTRSCGDPSLAACGRPLDRPFRFKDLPGELRNRIYEGLMPGEDGIKTFASASNLAHADDECLLAPGFRKLCLTEGVRGVDRQLRMEYDSLAPEHLKHMPLTVHVRVPSCSGDANYTYTRTYHRNDGLSCTPKLAYYPYNEFLVAYARAM